MALEEQENVAPVLMGALCLLAPEAGRLEAGSAQCPMASRYHDHTRQLDCKSRALTLTDPRKVFIQTKPYLIVLTNVTPLSAILKNLIFHISFFILNAILQNRGSQLETQTLQPHPRPTETETPKAGPVICLNKPSR